MSDKSDEELVGDVDFDFDLVEDAGNASQHKRQRETTSVSSRQQPVKKKKVAKAAVIQDDLLQAFAIGATSVKKVSKPVSKVKKNVGAQGKVAAITATEVKKNVGVQGKAAIAIAATAKQGNQSGIAKTEIKEKEVDGKTQVAGGIVKEKTNVEQERGITKMEIKGKEVEKKTEAIAATAKQGNQSGIAKTEIKEKEVDGKTQVAGGIVKEKTNVEQERGITKMEIKGKEVEKKTEAKEKVVKEKINDKDVTRTAKTEIKGKEVEGKIEVKREVVKEKIDTKEERGIAKSQIKEKEVVKKIQVKEEVVCPQKDNTKSDFDDRSQKSLVKDLSLLFDNSSTSLVSKPESGRNQTIKNTNSVNKKAVKLDKNSDVERKIPDVSGIKAVDESSKSQDLKRKANEDVSDRRHSAKSQRTDVSLQDEGNQPVDKEGTRFTEDDYRSMDNFLADQMLNKSKEKIVSKSGIKYTVQVSPLEIADLAHPSLQQLIGLHPTMSLTFKRQTVKFRKKKGYAEAAFSTMTELKEFVYQLTQIKVIENRIDVAITSLDKSDKLSFVIHLNRNGKLLNLLETGEDPMINKPIPMGENPGRIQFDKVPSNVNGAFMHSMFPFTNNVIIVRSQAGKDGKTVYHGPVSVFYINAKWLEAVMDCCCDFAVNGCPLTVIGDYSSDERSKKMKSAEKSEVTSESDQRTKSEYDDDDPVSNMTRDVCADMLDSIQKLRDLEPNNPNMPRLVEMQKKLSALQSSLDKSRSSDASEQEMCFNEGKLTAAEKKQKELKSAEEMFEEAERMERQKEEQMKQRRELEAQKKREFEQKKNSQWAKSMLSDFKKQDGAVGERMSADAKRILQQRERRLKEKEEEEKRRKEEEIYRQEEEEKLKIQREKDEKFREAERKRLIERIEETRLRDSQKFSSSQLQWDPSSSSYDAPSPKAGYKRDRDGDQHYKRAQKPKDDRMFAASSGMIDDSVDERLADFARALMQEGKIEKKALPFSPPSKSTERHYPSEREERRDDHIISEEEYQDLVASGQFYTIPENKLKVRITKLSNRLCPVQNCPSKTHFRDMELFMDHWVIFHQAKTTMRFCPMCSAYFMNLDELENHIMKHHRKSSKEAMDLVQDARKKVIPNPSYRDPFPFIAPLFQL